jgi:hypothetical protein
MAGRDAVRARCSGAGVVAGGGCSGAGVVIGTGAVAGGCVAGAIDSWLSELGMPDSGSGTPPSGTSGTPASSSGAQ